MQPSALLELNAYRARIANGSYSNRKELGLNLLPQPDKGHGLDFHPIVQALGGIVLDEANTSDYHIYLTEPPFEGAVFYLAHDDDSRLVFPSLDAFVDAADLALEQEAWLPDLHPVCSPIISDQAALSQLIHQCLDSPTDENEQVALGVIPSLDLLDLPLLERLASDENFFVAEAIAVEIGKRPARALQPIAALCAAHQHSQAAEAGQRALNAVDRLSKAG